MNSLSYEQRKKTVKWATELLKTLVFEFRIVSFEYFMEEMSIPQAYICIDNLQWTDFNFRTIMRYQIWSLYNSNGFGKNRNEIEDIMELPWDKEKKKHAIASDEELKQQKALMEQANEMMKGGKIIEEKYTL